MSKNLGWRAYVNEKGDFELPAYLYAINNDLMKQALDLGTLLSSDNIKLRAYKEQVKKIFKKRWLEMAQALEFFDIVVPCGCANTDYCDVCGGSRYRLNASLTPDEMREVGIVYGADQSAELADKLQKGLLKAIKDLEELKIDVL